MIPAIQRKIEELLKAYSNYLIHSSVTKAVIGDKKHSSFPEVVGEG